MRSIFSIFIFLISSVNLCFAQHAEVNVFEKSSHIKYLDSTVERFAKHNKLVGLTFHLINQGKVVYSKAYGHSNFQRTAPMTLNTVLPVTDATRLFTATAILKLLQEGKLSLEDKVFGPESYFQAEIPRVSKNVGEITIRYLLDRTSYLYLRELGTDKMINLKIAATKNKKIIEPGKSTTENEFNYYVLGRVIEKVSGQTYQEYITDMTKELFKNELTIPAQNLIMTKFNGRSKWTVKESAKDGDSMYGIFCSAGDLTTLLLSIDGYPAVKDMLIPTAVKISKSGSRVIPDKGNGWSVDKDGHFIHANYNGGATVVRMRKDGISWVITTVGGGYDFLKDADELPLKIIKRFRKLP